MGKSASCRVIHVEASEMIVSMSALDCINCRKTDFLLYI